MSRKDKHSVRFNDGLWEEMDSVAMAEDRSVSSLVKHAVKLYLKDKVRVRIDKSCNERPASTRTDTPRQ